MLKEAISLFLWFRTFLWFLGEKLVKLENLSIFQAACQLCSNIGPYFFTIVFLPCLLVPYLQQLGRLGLQDRLGLLDRFGRFGCQGKNLKYLLLGLSDASVLFGLKFTFWNGISNGDPYQAAKNSYRYGFIQK